MPAIEPGIELWLRHRVGSILTKLGGDAEPEITDRKPTIEARVSHDVLVDRVELKYSVNSLRYRKPMRRSSIGAPRHSDTQYYQVRIPELPTDSLVILRVFVFRAGSRTRPIILKARFRCINPEPARRPILELERRLLSVVNAVETAEQLDEAISPLLARLARRFHQADTLALADAMVRARLTRPHAIFTTIDEIADALIAPRSLLVELQLALNRVFLAVFKSSQLQRQFVRTINEATRESDVERFLSPKLTPLQELVGKVELHELATAILGSRRRRRDDRFTTIGQVADVVAIALLRRAFMQLVRQELLRGLEDAPWTTHPALLLPLRLETRFQDRKLLIRFYPDQFSVDTHRQQLSPTEYDAVRSYVESPSDDRVDSWRMLSTRFGSARAAWLVRWASGHDFDGAAPESRRTSWTDAPRLRALPDRFCVFAYRGEKVLRKVSRPVRKDRAMVGAFQSTVQLELGGTPGTVVPVGSLATHNPTGVQWSLNSNATIGASGIARSDATATSGTPTIKATPDWSIHSRVPGWETVKSSGASSLMDGLFDENSKWVFDFPTAVRDGFAVELELEDDDVDDDGIPRGMDRVIVVGVQWDTAARSAQQLEHLLQAHQFTDGLGFLRAGSPTNNTEQQASDYSTREDHEHSYRTHVEGPPNWAAQARGEARTNGQRLARALGIDPELLRFAEGSGGNGRLARPRDEHPDLVGHGRLLPASSFVGIAPWPTARAPEGASCALCARRWFSTDATSGKTALRRASRDSGSSRRRKERWLGSMGRRCLVGRRL